MIKFGIFTTSSEIWFHFHPLEPNLYYYWVTDCRDYIVKKSLKTVPCRSKDGTITARGFLIPKSALFIKRRELARGRVGSTERWLNYTDREAGLLYGPPMVIKALRQKDIFPELGDTVEVTESESDQRKSIDIFIDKIPAEIKTERVESGNLLVQDEEGRHNPNLLADGTVKMTVLPAFAKEVAPVVEFCEEPKSNIFLGNWLELVEKGFI